MNSADGRLFEVLTRGQGQDFFEHSRKDNLKKVKNINLVKHAKRSGDYLDFSDEFYDDDGKSFHDVFGDDDSEGSVGSYKDDGKSFDFFE